MEFFLLICWILILQGADSEGAAYNNRRKDSDLLFAQTICRHGDRNMYLFYETDPWTPEEYWPGGYSQLTNIGKEQHYKLGQFFGRRYSKLLGDGSYSTNKIYVQSSDKDRVLMSAAANMAGLFPPSGEQVWNPQIDWQPVPVHTTPLNEDYKLAGEKKCDRFDYVMLQYMNTTAYTDYFTENLLLIKELEKMSGNSLTTITNITNLYDTLFIEKLKGFRLPTWADQALQNDAFLYLAYSWYEIFTSLPEMKMLRSGYLLKEILDRFTNKTLSTLTPDRSLWMYFAHDITIANMLNSVGLFKLEPPPYASCILFELIQDDDIPYVEIFYRDDVNDEHPPALNIPGCGTPCPLSKMYELFDDILPTESFDDACKLRSGETLPLRGNPENNAL